jgi:hypothetical protein
MLWFLWIMATSVGWVLGRLLLPNLALVTVGLAIGILQWFLLQRRFKQAWQWILATAAGWMVGSVISYAAIPAGMDFLVGILVGITTGSAQWLILRREVRWAGWWIIINVVAWTTGLAFLPGLISTGAIVGLITATALALLLNAPRQATTLSSE